MRLEDHPCNLCGSTDNKILGQRDASCFKESKGADVAVKIVKCKGCGLIYANPMPIYSSEDFMKIYSLDYYPTSDEGSVKRSELRYKKLMRYVGNPQGKILEIGSGKGYFLYLCQQEGWDAHGVEVSPEAGCYARETFGLHIFVGELRDVNYPSGYFDVVFSDQVLEHLPDPTSFLGEIGRILKDGGLLFIACPNEGGILFKVSNLYFKVLRKKWTANLSPLHPSYHVHGFSPKTLKMLLEKAGFHVRKLSCNSGSNEGMEMYSPFLRYIRQAIMWSANVIGQGDALEAYAIK